MPISAAPQTAASVSSSVAGSRDRISSSTGMPKTKERPKSPWQDAAEKGEILLVERPVEPVAGDRVEPDLLGDVGADQHVDRVADRVDAGEDQRRHDEHHRQRLHQPLDHMA